MLNLTIPGPSSQKVGFAPRVPMPSASTATFVAMRLTRGAMWGDVCKRKVCAPSASVIASANRFTSPSNPSRELRAAILRVRRYLKTTMRYTDDGVYVKVSVNKGDLNDIREQLAQLPPRLAKRMVRSSFKKACEYLRDLMRSKAPVLADKSNKNAVPGELGDSIDYKISTGRGGKRGADANALDRIYAKVGPKWITKSNKTMNPGLYALFVEFGLRAKQYVSKPFVRPTFDSGAERALNMIADDLREGLPEIVAKRGTGGHE